MPFTDAQIAEIRTWVPWSPPTDAALDDAADRLSNSIYQVAREFLRARLMELVADPASFSIPGDYSQNTGENMRVLGERIKELDALVDAETAGTDGEMSSGYLCRDDPSRRATAGGAPDLSGWPTR